MEWPGFDERPGGHRQRLQSEVLIRDRQQVYYRDSNGRLLVPADGVPMHHRSSSDAGRIPAQVIINNDIVQWEDQSARQPRSSHRHGDFLEGVAFAERERSRSRSRVRMRTPSPYYELDYETRDRLKRLEELEKKEADERRKKQIEEHMMLKAAKEQIEREERKKEEEELKKKAIAEWKVKEEEEKEKKKKAEEKAEEEARERTRRTLWANGYSDEEIDRMLRRAEKKEHHHEHTHVVAESSTTLALSRPTYIKVHRKYLETETLDVFHLPWTWDEHDLNYIIIQQWVPQNEQDALFEHTRKLREKKLITHTTTTELRKEHDQLLLVRRKDTKKKSPVRTSWFLT